MQSEIHVNVSTKDVESIFKKFVHHAIMNVEIVDRYYIYITTYKYSVH